MATVLRQWQTATDRIDPIKLSFLSWLSDQDAARQDAYRVYREYYDGDHDTQLTARMRRYLQIKMGEEFNANYCPIVVDALADRLDVQGFEAGEQGAALWEWWQANAMDRTQGQTHTAAIRDGDAYLLISWDNERTIPLFTLELAYDGTEGVKLHYDPENRSSILFASKRWRVEQGQDAGDQRRMNLYYPDRIEKYVSYAGMDEGHWMEHHEEGEEWPIPWVDGAGAPLGVPFAHFKNRDQGYSFGQSGLKSVIPLQNALNKSIIDLLAAADTTGFRLYYATGDKFEGYDIVPGTFIVSEKAEAAVGAIEGEDLTKLIKLKDSFAMEIARVSRTPLSYFQISGQRAAEGTLQQEEQPLVSKARTLQTSFGAVWAGAMAFARRLHNTYGEGGLDEGQDIEAIWADPQTRNEKAHLESLKIKADLGVPWERIMVECGYDQDSIDKMRAWRGEELQQTSNIGGELLRAFERGG